MFTHRENLISVFKPDRFLHLDFFSPCENPFYYPRTNAIVSWISLCYSLFPSGKLTRSILMTTSPSSGFLINDYLDNYDERSNTTNVALEIIIMVNQGPQKRNCKTISVTLNTNSGLKPSIWLHWLCNSVNGKRLRMIILP